MFIRELLDFLAKNAKEAVKRNRDDKVQETTHDRLRHNAIRPSVIHSGPLGLLFPSLKMKPANPVLDNWAEYDRRYNQERLQGRAKPNTSLDPSAAFKPEAQFKPDAAIKKPRF